MHHFNLTKKLCRGLCFILIYLLQFTLVAQTLTDSNLPIVIITTDGNAGIPDAPRILANMKIIYKGPGVRNSLTDQNDPLSLNYNGRINIEVRGSSSQALDKKQYGFSTLMPDNNTNNNVSLLSMPEENDWVLNGFAFEPSLIRDYISYNLSRAIGEYAPRTAYCELVINGNYRGLYMLQEKVKVDDNRVNVAKINPEDNFLPNLTGGYLIKADKVTPEDPSAWTMSSYLGSNDVNFIYEFPKPSDITFEQSNYIRQQFFQLANTSNNASIGTGYPSIIDVPSFINFILINELSANVDAYQFSTFFHKDKRGKIRAGPLWDLNLTYGNDLFVWGLDRSKTNQWQFDNGDNIGAKFWKDLFNNTTFKCYLSKRWNMLTQVGQPLNLTSIYNLIDQTVSDINEAVVRENARWGTIGNHSSRINDLKTFLASRTTWITNALGPFSACNNIVTPPLVISKIMYHPAVNTSFTSSSDQEFIEIVNNGNDPVDMTGVYFSGTGFVYQFPNGYFFPPQGILHLANRLETFEERYNLSAFGEFSRSLNNNGQRITLADAFGNVIDDVSYSTQSPWPEVSGNGLYLKLNSLNSDNDNGANWVAGNDALTTNVIASLDEGVQLDIYPNPINEFVNINSNQEMKFVQIYDLRGMAMKSRKDCFCNSITLNVGQYPPGIYLLVINTSSKVIVQKLTKSP